MDATESHNQRERYWRSLEEFAHTPRFREWMEREFPAAAMEWDQATSASSGNASGGAAGSSSGFSRRRFLQLMGASLALAGLPLMAGCRRRENRILPYQKKPEDIIPGKAMYYASTFVLAGVPMGILAETHEGRPTKLEGNPLHPTSFGALSHFAQASILDLYDPDRSRYPVQQGKPVAWAADVLPMLDKLAAELKTSRGQGLAILSEASCSPALTLLREHLGDALPEARWYEHDLAAQLTGTTLDAEGTRLRYDLGRAQVILAMDCDLLGLEDEGVAHKRDFSRGRKIGKPGDRMNRLYVVEPHFTLTGMSADHRLRLSAALIPQFLLALAQELGVQHGSPAKLPSGVDPRWVTELAADLRANAGACLVVVGARQPDGVRRLALDINRKLGNEGRTIRATRLPTSNLPRAGTLHDLSRSIRQDEVRTLVILGGNPIYTAPADVDFTSDIRKVALSIHLGTYFDETAAACTWHINQAHPYESWGDARIDETLSPVQPLIDPLFEGKTALELLARLSGYRTNDPYEIVRDSFRRLHNEVGGVDVEAAWRQYLNTGVYKVRSAQHVPLEALSGSSAALAFPEPAPDKLEICFAPSYHTLDGRFANNGWLQELPDPITKLVWDNAALLGPATAARLGNLKHGDVIEITVDGRKLALPVSIVPGSAENSILLTLGHGRVAGGPLATHSGFNAGKLFVAPVLTSAAVRKLGRTYPLASTQEHWAIETHELIDGVLKDRAIVREGTLAEYEKHPEFAQHMGIHVPHKKDIRQRPALDAPNQWGMAIDLTSCIGCNACVAACQAENNIPIVGKDEVIRGREMHWIRIDRYFQGPDPAGDVTVAQQPMLCQHCEAAPCEPVCPANATVHNHEGLNVMVYNRCVGTRYCSNNCPYKVRRFNFFDYNKGTLRESVGTAEFSGNPEPNPTTGFALPQLAQPQMQELLKMQKNPEVTVRMRGVMEKCTFCVQRIEKAKIDQRVDAGQNPLPDIPDGTIRTACQQTCPTEAIVFGDLADPKSRVAQLKAQERNYAVLEHLNIHPRTSYLARLRNLNPRMPTPESLHTPGHSPGHASTVPIAHEPMEVRR